MDWNSFYTTNAAKSLKVWRVEDHIEHVSYVTSTYHPLATSSTTNIADYFAGLPYTRTHNINLFKTDELTAEKLDAQFFDLLDGMTPRSSTDIHNCHVSLKEYDKIEHHFYAMDSMLMYHSYNSANIFVSSYIKRLLYQEYQQNLSDFAQRGYSWFRKFFEFTDGFGKEDKSIVGTWQNATIYEAKSLLPNVMFMTGMPDILGAMPMKDDVAGPKEIGLAILQPQAIAKGIV